MAEMIQNENEEKNKSQGVSCDQKELKKLISNHDISVTAASASLIF